MITLKDIAKEANVSVMTVSRVINGNHAKVSEKTAKRVQQIIDRMGYIPNSSARSLITKESRIVVLFIYMNSYQRILMSPHNSILIENIARSIQSRSYDLMIRFVDTAKEISQCLRSWNVAGCILMGMYDGIIEEIEKDTNVPKVYIDTHGNDNVCMVGIDDRKGGYIAAEYLYRKGHTNLAMVDIPSVFKENTSHLRYAGFEHFILEQNGRIKLHHIVSSDCADICRQIMEVRETGCSAVFFAADNIAIETMDLLKSHGIRIPEDISCLGFDNQHMSSYVTPKLTTIAQDIAGKGKTAVDVLFELMQAEDGQRQVKKVLLPIRIVERASVCELKEI